MSALKAAKARRAAERQALGAGYRSGAYVVSNEIGDPHSPAVLSRYWRETVEAVGLCHIKLQRKSAFVSLRHNRIRGVRYAIFLIHLMGSCWDRQHHPRCHDRARSGESSLVKAC